MNATTELRDDLNFVAAAVRRTGSPGVPAILLLWAVLVPVGFALADFAPHYSGLYWFVAGPMGGLVSFWLAHLASKAIGVRDTALGRRHGLHWITMGVAFVLLAGGIAKSHVDVATIAPIFMLITAMTYTFAGIHLEDSRALFPAGLIMFGGYAALVWLPVPYPWTVTGLFVSAALIVAALRSRRAAPDA